MRIVLEAQNPQNHRVVWVGGILSNMLWGGFFTLGLAVTGAMIFFTCFFLNGLRLITVNQPSLFGQNSNILVALMRFQTDGL